MKKIFALSLLAFALLALPGSACDLPGAATGKTDATQADLALPDQPELQPALGVPAPRAASCTTICSADFKACRDSCHSLTCYNQCRDALDVCTAGC